MREGDRQAEQERPREVQVVGRLDHFVPEQRDELARLHREPAPQRDLVRAVGLLEVERGRVPKRERVVRAAENPERVVLLRVLSRRQHHAEAERVALGRVLLRAELRHVEGVAPVEIVQAQLVVVAPPVAVEVEHDAVLDVREQDDLLEQRLRPLGRLLLPERGGGGEADRRREDQPPPHSRHAVSP